LARITAIQPPGADVVACVSLLAMPIDVSWS
jgi:hypothetical protein